MRTPDYIPSNMGDFNEFQSSLNLMVQDKAASWNIPDDEAAALNTWSMGYSPYYDAAKNKNDRTRQQLIDHDVYRDAYVAFLRPFVQSFLVNNTIIPLGVRKAMGLNPRGVNVRKPRPKIEAAPIPAMQPLGQAAVRFTFKIMSSDKRIARQPDSNGIEIFYKFTSTNAAPPQKPEPVNELGMNGTVVKEDGFETAIYTRAQFRVQFPLYKVGQTIHLYSRWINTSEPDKSSPFSGIISMVIS